MRIVKKKHFAKKLGDFLAGCGKKYDFDDLVGSRIEDPILENYRMELIDLPNYFPPEKNNMYASEAGIRRMRDIINELSK